MGPAGQAQLQLRRLSTTAYQPALRLLSTLVPPYIRLNNPWYPRSNSTHTSDQATGHSSEVLSAPFTHSPRPWGRSRAVQAREQGLQNYGDYIYSLNHAGTRRRGARHLDCCTCGHVLSMLLGLEHSKYVSACSCPMFSGSAIVGYLIPQILALRHVPFIIAHLLTFGAAPGPCKRYTWYHVSMLGVVALWTMQRFAVVGPATWTAAHSAAGCAA